jgi:hypothetical protein
VAWHRPHFTARPVGEKALLCTRHQAAFILSVHPDTVKRRYLPVACDVRTRLPLYDPLRPLERSRDAA